MMKIQGEQFNVFRINVY